MFEQLSLLTSGKGLSGFSREDRLYVAIRFMAPVEMVSKLEELSDVQLCWNIKENLFHNRNTAVTAFLNGSNALSLSSTQALLSWKDCNFGKCVPMNGVGRWCSQSLYVQLLARRRL